MTLNIMDLLQPVYQTILAAYTQPPMEGLPPGNSRSDTFVTIIWPGQEIDEQQYGNAWSPQNPTGSQDAIENITLLADAIPNLSAIYEPSGNSVENLYGQILNASPIRTAATNKDAAVGGPAARHDLNSISPGDAAAPAAPDTSSFLNEIALTSKVSTVTEAGKPIQLISVSDDVFKEAELHAAYSDAAASLTAKRMQFDLTDAAQAQQWGAVAPQYEAAVQTAWAALERHGEQAELKTSADISISIGSEDSLPQSLNAMSPSSSGDGGDDLPPILQAFTKARGVFDGSRLASAKNPGLSYHPAYVTPANFADPEASKSWPTIQILPTQIRSNSGATNSQVSFKFARVNIIRPWLAMSLLKLSGWRVQGMGPGFLSNGQSADNEGTFTLLPTAMIVVRDLSITPVGTNAATADSFPILTSNGLQILAWINKVVPFSPPNQ